MKFGQLTLAVDGTKIGAHARKHSAVSYRRAGQQIEWRQQEVGQLLAKADQAGRAPCVTTGMPSARCRRRCSTTGLPLPAKCTSRASCTCSTGGGSDNEPSFPDQATHQRTTGLAR